MRQGNETHLNEEAKAYLKEICAKVAKASLSYNDGMKRLFDKTYIGAGKFTGKSHLFEVKRP